MKTVRYTPFILILCIGFSLLGLSASPSEAQWSRKSTIPSGGSDAAFAFAIGNKAYYGGGTSSNPSAFYEYDPATNLWTKNADIPIAKYFRAFGVSFAIGSKGYIAFGQSDTSSLASENYGQKSVTKDLWEYDPSSDKWTRKADLPGVPRDGLMAFVVGNKAYVGSGVDGSGNYLGDFYEYDPAKDAWTQKADLPTGNIGFPMAFAIDTLGYMVGGVTSTELTDAYSYSPSTDQWTLVAPFPGAARQAGIGFTIDSLGYIGLGTANQYSTMFADFYSYNPATDRWKAVAGKFPVSTGLGWPATAVVGHTAYIGGGAPPSFNYSSAWYSFSTTQAFVVGMEPATSGIAYPNPASNIVRLSLPALHDNASVTIVSMLGQTIAVKQADKGSIDVTALTPGVYSLQITSGDYHASQRFVKD